MSKEKEKIDNPFVTTGYVSAEYFCDREKETQDIIRYLTNGNNVALISPRRYGKSDLLRIPPKRWLRWSENWAVPFLIP